MVYCGLCGTQQPDARARFCFTCGERVAGGAADGGGAAARQTRSMSPQHPGDRQQPPQGTAGKTSVRVAKNKFRMVPPFAVGGCLEASDASAGENAFARYKRYAVYRPEDGDAAAAGGGTPNASFAQGSYEAPSPQAQQQQQQGGGGGGPPSADRGYPVGRGAHPQATPQRTAAPTLVNMHPSHTAAPPSQVSSIPPSPSHAQPPAGAGSHRRTPRRRGRAMVPSATNQIDESARDHIFPVDNTTTTGAGVAAVAGSAAGRVSPARRSVKSEAEVIREARQMPGVIRRVRVRKKHMSCRNGMVVDEDNYVAEVTQNGPADLAGARVGMRILSVDGEVPVNSADTANLMRCKEFALVVLEPEPAPAAQPHGRTGSREPPRGTRGRSSTRHGGYTHSSDVASDSEYCDPRDRDHPHHHQQQHPVSPSRSRWRDRSGGGYPDSPSRYRHASPYPNEITRAGMPYDHRDQRAQDFREIEQRHHEFDRSPRRASVGGGRSPRASTQDERARALNERHREKQRMLRELHGGQHGDGGGGGQRRSPSRRRDSVDAKAANGGKGGGGHSAVVMDISPPPPTHKRRETPSPRAHSASAAGESSRNRKHSPRPCPGRQPLQVNEEFFRSTPDSLRPSNVQGGPPREGGRLERIGSGGVSVGTASSVGNIVKCTKSTDGIVIYHSPRKRSGTPTAQGSARPPPDAAPTHHQPPQHAAHERGPYADSANASITGLGARELSYLNLEAGTPQQPVFADPRGDGGAAGRPPAPVQEELSREEYATPSLVAQQPPALPEHSHPQHAPPPESRPTRAQQPSQATPVAGDGGPTDVASERFRQRQVRHAMDEVVPAGGGAPLRQLGVSVSPTEEPPPPRSLATPSSRQRFASRSGALDVGAPREDTFAPHSDDDGTLETLVIPRERQLNTSETWPSDPLLTARTTPKHGASSKYPGRCVCTSAPHSLRRAYSCTYCNAACCMDCYWRGRCYYCAEAGTDSRFRWSEGATPVEEKPFRTSKRVCTHDKKCLWEHRTARGGTNIRHGRVRCGGGYELCLTTVCQ